MSEELTQSVLKAKLHYAPDTGVFTWRTRASQKVLANSPAGYINYPSGYLKITINGTKYYAHRLAFLYMTGATPSGQVDHINHERGDNRWANLRVATSMQNGANKKLGGGGYRGIEIRKNGRYVVQIGSGPSKYKGTFSSMREAVTVYILESLEMYGSFSPYNCHGSRV